MPTTGGVVSPPTPPITPDPINVRLDRHPDDTEPAAYRNLSRQGVRVEHGVPF